MDAQVPIHTITSSEELSDAQPKEHPRKRVRVSLACQRCKARKQRCDGGRPACSSCLRLDAECKYVAPHGPKLSEKNAYIRALEDRIADLETHLATVGDSSYVSDHWKPAEPEPRSPREVAKDSPSAPSATSEDAEMNNLFNLVRDLSLSNAGYYIGGTATAWGRKQNSIPRDDPSPKSISNSVLLEKKGKWFFGPVVADRLLQAYFDHIATQFPVVHTPRLREMHARRESHLSLYEESILHLVYAISGRFLETTGETGNFFSDEHYNTALSNLDEIIDFRDLKSMTFLLLLAIYCLRAPRDPGAWIYTSLAMRQIIELGLFRKHKVRVLTIDGELAKRLFYTCYWLDREVGPAMGRPPSIPDGYIDVELPLDIDEAVDESTVVENAAQNIVDHPLNPPTTLSNWIHHLRLKIIESKIHDAMYCVNRPVDTSPEVMQGFIDQLNAWRDAIPEYHIRQNDPRSQSSLTTYMISYYKSMRSLLYPLLAESPVNIHYLKICSEACSGICSSYKLLIRNVNIGFSPLSLQSVFLAGLTLTYCLWLAPSEFMSLITPLTDCSIVLYIITERFPSARKYRDIFEETKKSVMEVIASGKAQPRVPVEINAALHTQSQSSSSSRDAGLFTHRKEDISQMLSDMTGNNATLDQSSSQEQAGLKSNITAGIYGPLDEEFWEGFQTQQHPDDGGMGMMDDYPVGSRLGNTAGFPNVSSYDAFAPSPMNQMFGI